MGERIHPVAPTPNPTVFIEKLLKRPCHILHLRLQRPAIHKQRQPRVVGDLAVIFEVLDGYLGLDLRK